LEVGSWEGGSDPLGKNGRLVGTNFGHPVGGNLMTTAEFLPDPSGRKSLGFFQESEALPERAGIFGVAKFANRLEQG
jgi:hypothetical protein